MKFVLAFLAGCALVGTVAFLLAESEAPLDGEAAPIQASLAAESPRRDMDLQPAAPRATAEPVAAPLSAAPTPDAGPLAAAPAGAVTPEALADLVDERVKEVLAEREAAEREDREAREEQFIRDRAHAIAEEVGLGQRDEGQLAELMLAANAQRDELRDALRNGAMPFAERESLRDKFEAIDTDYHGKLDTQFGPSVSQEIQSASANGWRGGRGGPGRGR